MFSNSGSESFIPFHIDTSARFRKRAREKTVFRVWKILEKEFLSPQGQHSLLPTCHWFVSMFIAVKFQIAFEFYNSNSIWTSTAF